MRRVADLRVTPKRPRCLSVLTLDDPAKIEAEQTKKRCEGPRGHLPIPHAAHLYSNVVLLWIHGGTHGQGRTITWEDLFR